MCAGPKFPRTKHLTSFDEIILITQFALVGCETCYSQLGATRLFGYFPSHMQHALME